jgi:hypothetical protein
MHREKDNGCGEAYFYGVSLSEFFFSRSVSNRIKHFLTRTITITKKKKENFFRYIICKIVGLRAIIIE